MGGELPASAIHYI
jgi:hypothetical protein